MPPMAYLKEPARRRPTASGSSVSARAPARGYSRLPAIRMSVLPSPTACSPRTRRWCRTAKWYRIYNDQYFLQGLLP